MRMFKPFFEVFWPKAKESVADQGLNNILNITGSDLILETLQKNLKLLSAKACDIEEEIKNGELSGRKKRKREVKEWLEEVESIKVKVDELGKQAESKRFIMRFLNGGKAAQLNEQVEKLLQQSLSFTELMLDARGTMGEKLSTNGMVGEAFNENLERILKLLENRKVSKIGVYGMGGAGKTTLAKHIHNLLLQRSQGRVFWITVSQEFTITSLQGKIARCLGVGLSDEDEEAIRAGRLKRFLSQEKNSVLILDDVWEKIDMEKMGCTFSVECCRLIVTTRSTEVCHRIGCTKLIPVVKLGKEEAWKLFIETLENETELGPQVEEIAKSMAEVCDGLPLGIITLAGSMKGVTAIRRWNDALTELKDCVAGVQDERGEFNEVFRVLKYSFDRLKTIWQNHSTEFNKIQHCFMYCSLYPEDYEIVRDDVVRKFISEGLADERRSGRAQVEQGHSILDKLVNLCLLESFIDVNGEECVKMHDLVRGMALEIGKGKYMVRAGDYSFHEITDVKEWTEGLEKVSFMCSKIRRIENGISPNCPNLSTLLLCEDYELKVIPESFFSKMQGLCTLNLCNTLITMLPDSISDMMSLKALVLEGCERLEKVPYLGKLKALRILNLSCTAIEEAPQGLEELLNLRFLSMDAPGLKMLPSGLLLKLVHLQHLNLPLHIKVEIEEIENLREVEEFGGGVKNVNDFNVLIATRVDGACFKIGVNLFYDTDDPSTLVIGEDLECHENELMLNLCNLKDEKVLGQRIVRLSIIECEGLSKCFVDDLPRRFNNPTSLRKLIINRCGAIEWILRSDCQGSQFTLEKIDLKELDDLKGVVMERGEIGASAPAQLVVFSSLKELEIYKCKKIRKVGLPVSGVPNLEKLLIMYCGEIEETFEENEGRGASTLTTLPKLKKLALYGLPRLKKVGLSISGVPNLEDIEITECEEIEEILEEDEGRVGSIVTTLTLPKLKKLWLRDLPRVRKVGLAVWGVPNLEWISIASCGAIEEILKEDEGRATSSITILPKLNLLKLKGLPRLRKVGLPVLGVPNVREIEIENCGEIEEIFEYEGTAGSITTLPKLGQFTLRHLPRLKSVSKATIFSNFIYKIEIRKCPRLKKLPLHMDVSRIPFVKEILVEREWWESLERDINPNLPQLLSPFVEFQD